MKQKKSKWPEIIKRAEREITESGITIREWCEKNNIDYGGMINAMRRYRKKGVSNFATKARRSREERIELVKRGYTEAKEQGISLEEWAKRNNIKSGSTILATWRKELLSEEEASKYNMGEVRTTEEWVEIINRAYRENAKTGITIRDWCAKNGVHYGTFREARLRYLKDGRLKEYVATRHKNRSEEEWLEIVKNGVRKQKEEGVSNTEWCRQNEIGYNSFMVHKWDFMRRGLLDEDGE